MLGRIMTETTLKQCLEAVLTKIENACAKRPPEFQAIKPTLVAVSKIKPAELVIEAYEAGQRHFGENYVQELEDKANDPTILEKCKDIKWHFIGHLQNNKVNKVLSVPNLYIVETVDSKKLASKLNSSWEKFRKDKEKLRVMVQINTSAEDEKNGIPPSEAPDFVKFIQEDCPNLEFNGLMTIGKYGHNPEDGPNPDFLTLIKCRDEVCKQLTIDWDKLPLSMGMSADYEQAIEMGSSYVRVGTAIFGERPQKVTSK